MAMKLETALKLYIVLYVLCFCLTWFVSVPMLIHVVPDNECLLFVSPFMNYGSSATCHIVGFAPLFVAVSALLLIVLHIIQLRSLRVFLSKPGPWRSADYERPPHIYWRMVIFHGLVTIGMIAITAILTAGYVDTCTNLYREVQSTLRGRYEVGKWGGAKGNNELYDRFANDHSIERYLSESRDPWGRSAAERSITCRSILTDFEIHYQLKLNHLKDPYNNAYIGPYSEHERGLADIRHTTIRDNMILELCLAGCWISTVIWLIIMLLMLLMRHHLRARLADESIWGSEFGESRRGGSRLSNHSFDKMSQSRYSQFSGSDMSGRRGRGTRGGSQAPSTQNGDVPGYPIRVGPPPVNHHAVPTYSTATPAQQKNLLDYFTGNPNPKSEDEVDIDEALGDFQTQQDFNMEPQPDEFMPNESALDTSFEFPIDHNVGAGDPIPLGDDVSNGTMRSIPIQVNTPRNTQSTQNTPQYPMHHNPNPNRVVGRRGARGSGMSPTYPGRQSALDTSMHSYQEEDGNYTEEYNEHELEHHQYDYNDPSSSAYRTRLGQSSMI
eukprot:maker-scaffold534_size144770-snap-gene-0.37 protein:Tk11144 transcript:maker-scaffold534_size144770-snap-gene-0.37-mRNA-1 annotation:"hypothetical protein CGI_10017331"